MTKRFMRGKALAGAFLAVFLLSMSALAQAAEDIQPMDSRKLLSFIANEGKGKVVVVNIFASWCPPCKKEVPNLIALRSTYPADKVVFIGVSMDTEMKALRDFVAEHKINYPVFLASGDFSAAFGVELIPQLLLFDKKGELVVNYTGLAESKELIEAIESFLK